MGFSIGDITGSISDAVSNVGGALGDVATSAAPIVGLGATAMTGNPLWMQLGSSVGNYFAGQSAAEQVAAAQRAAAGQSAAATTEALKQQREMYDISRADQLRLYEQARADLAAQRAAGQYGAETLTGMMPEMLAPYTMEDWQASPEYQFQLEQGLNAAQNAAAAGGRLGSGRYLKDLTRFGQVLAATEYGNAFARRQAELGNKYNMLAGMAGFGQFGANQPLAQASALTGQAMNYGTNVGNLMMQRGNALAQGTLGAGQAAAAGTLGGANVINQGLGNLASWWGSQQQPGLWTGGQVGNIW